MSQGDEALAGSSEEELLADGSPQRNETPAERLDRNLSELVQELRVAQTFVQFLFAALLAIPFQQRFAKLTHFQHDAYALTLVLTMASAVLLVTPATFHRIVFRHGMKRQLVAAADRLMKWGLLCLALAMTCALALVLDVVSGRHLLFWCVVPLGALSFLLLWWALPTASLRHELLAREERRAAQPGSAGLQDR